jgi:hypothetical protein
MTDDLERVEWTDGNGMHVLRKLVRVLHPPVLYPLAPWTLLPNKHGQSCCIAATTAKKRFYANSK